jgi:thiol:disulfide interchange protein
MSYFHVVAPPTFIFFSQGKEQKKLVGELSTAHFLEDLRQVLSKDKKA